MRKIDVTRQCFGASGRHGDFFEKTKNPFLDKVDGSMCANLRPVSFFVWPGDVSQINKAIKELCGKSTGYGSFSRPAALGSLFLIKRFSYVV